MKKCVNPKCNFFKYAQGGLFRTDEKYCSECGKELMEKKDMNYCCRCDYVIGDNAKFCTHCGLPREEAVKNSDDVSKEVGAKVEEFKSKAGPRGRHGEDIPRGLDSDDKEKR